MDAQEIGSIRNKHNIIIHNKKLNWDVVSRNRIKDWLHYMNIKVVKTKADNWNLKIILIIIIHMKKSNENLLFTK